MESHMRSLVTCFRENSFAFKKFNY
jgi:hypothetical protein